MQKSCFYYDVLKISGSQRLYILRNSFELIKYALLNTFQSCYFANVNIAQSTESSKIRVFVHFPLTHTCIHTHRTVVSFTKPRLSCAKTKEIVNLREWRERNDRSKTVCIFSQSFSLNEEPTIHYISLFCKLFRALCINSHIILS